MKTLLFSLILLGALAASAQNPTLELNDLKPGAKELEAIDLSKPGELNIASMNVRDMIGTRRSLEQFEYLMDRMAGADIIVLQEIGAKGLTKNKEESVLRRIDAFLALSCSLLGDEWSFAKAPEPTPNEPGMGAELPVVLYRTMGYGFEMKISWNSYFDLGEKRDLGVFDAILSSKGTSSSFQIATTHTTPKCPDRSTQLLGIANYAESAEGDFIICGDFNWGYKSSCGDASFEGETKLLVMESNEQIFIPFSSISSFGGEKGEAFRTNLMIRSTGFMYDQFILSPSFAGKMADGASLSKDCGFLSISEGKMFEKQVDRETSARVKGAKQALKTLGYDVKSDEGKAQLKKIEDDIDKDRYVKEAATYFISDHKPVWVQLKLF